MYALLYEDLLAVELTKENTSAYKELDKAETFEDAKQEIVNYWENKKKEAELKLEQAQNMKPLKRKRIRVHLRQPLKRGGTANINLNYPNKE
ncbi:hypothetical protein [Marinifilum sp. D714]|uniref:hypothetical protein n=1 Tax=Marinifilum sp. D714 TaxID=2937523 RepID=UPI0027C9CE68|nr:hypothetical protein [Marinifilum sp. D714]MDQ2178812.1 hypothetical protein [Marinifilum sp. D714]